MPLPRVGLQGHARPCDACRGFYPVVRGAQEPILPILEEASMADMPMREGGCHCGKVRFQVATDLAKLISCNCSICSKHGLILTFVPEAQFKLLSGAADLQEYLFNKHHIHHQFCRTCGVEPFARGTPPGSSTAMMAINVRCLDGIDIASLKPTPFDGRSL
jgi:hypothetical protein